MRCGCRSSPRAASARWITWSRASARAMRPRCSPPRSSISARSASARPRRGSPPPACRCGLSDGRASSATPLERLWQVIESRRGADPAHLLHRQAVRAAAAPRSRRSSARKRSRRLSRGSGTTATALVGESADLLYHLLVLWAATGVSPADVAAELARREGTSGIAEVAVQAGLIAPHGKRVADELLCQGRQRVIVKFAGARPNALDGLVRGPGEERQFQAEMREAVPHGAGQRASRPRRPARRRWPPAPATAPRATGSRAARSCRRAGPVPGGGAAAPRRRRG